MAIPHSTISTGAESRRRPWQTIPAKLVAIARAQLFTQQVLLEFPIEELKKRADALAVLPSDFMPVVPRTDDEFAAWVSLLNEEPDFGHWTLERLKSELLGRLVPNAALTIWHEGRAIACACALDTPRGSRRIATGMYLYVTPKYRGRSDVAYATTYGMLYQCVGQGYDQVVASTDPTRLSALALYLSNGCRPVRRTLRCWYRWRGIMKRLGPTLEKMKQRKARASRTRPRTAPDTNLATK